MDWSELKFGAVVLHEDFEFPDGGQADKLFVVLGIRSDSALIALTTSRPPTPDVNYGCTAKRSFFKAQALPRDCFDKDTYALLWRLGELLPRNLQAGKWKTNTRVIGTLSEQTAHAVKNCASATDDITPRQKSLLGPPPAPPKATWS